MALNHKGVPTPDVIYCKSLSWIWTSPVLKELTHLEKEGRLESPVLASISALTSFTASPVSTALAPGTRKHLLLPLVLLVSFRHLHQLHRYVLQGPFTLRPFCEMWPSRRCELTCPDRSRMGINSGAFLQSSLVTRVTAAPERLEHINVA